MASFKTWLAGFEKTFLGKITVSAVRAFIGVFVVAELNIFNDVVNAIQAHTVQSLSTLEALLAALVSAGFVAAVRAIQHFFFDPPATP